MNVGAAAYEGELLLGNAGTWQMLEPATGTIGTAESKAPGRLRLRLGARQAVILVL